MYAIRSYYEVSQSYWSLVWWKFRKNRLAVIGAGGFADWGMSVDTLLTEHATFMAWAKSAADAILPDGLAHFFLGAPALIIFPVRAVIAGLLGSWALKAARRRNRVAV